jgi:D-3-phosphoglycerate dehydrogenase
LPGYQGLVVRSRTEVDAEVIAAATSLQVIGRAGIGVDNVDLAAATRAGIVVMNTPLGNAVTTAEHTLSLLLSLARHIPQASASMRAGVWEKSRFVGMELDGKLLAVIGLGNIGRLVAARAKGLGMRVVGCDPFFDANAAAKLGVELMGVDDALRVADVVTVHTPLNEHTRGIINAARIDTMKPGVLLVNCARGGIYDERALLDGLNAGRIGGVALDVFVEEPPPKDHPLLTHERVIATPHLGASTSEAQLRVVTDLGRQICEFAAGGPARNAVNVPAVSSSARQYLGPYFELASALGTFLAQVSDAPVRAVSVALEGEVATRASHGLLPATLAGILRRTCDHPVNQVNAVVLAEERGIRVAESKSPQAGSYTSAVSVSVQTERGARRAVGTVFGDGQGRIVSVDDVPLEFIPQGHVLFCVNRDEPGVIGQMGRILGDAGINISRMNLGLANGTALSAISVDQAVAPAVVADLKQGPVLRVQAVAF